jgi:hypothetical protein
LSEISGLKHIFGSKANVSTSEKTANPKTHLGEMRTQRNSEQSVAAAAAAATWSAAAAAAVSAVSASVCVRCRRDMREYMHDEYIFRMYTYACELGQQLLKI